MVAHTISSRQSLHRNSGALSTQAQHRIARDSAYPKPSTLPFVTERPDAEQCRWSHSTAARYRPVCEASTLATCSGVPSATM